jgi:dipeptidyl aminopeptidase/acylaminoacyl peptidase
MISRRRFLAGAAGASMLAPNWRSVNAQNQDPAGKIAFVKEGDIWVWSSDEGVRRLIEDGSALDPTWSPTGGLLMYARDGGSFSDLILANPETQNRKRLTDNESTAEKGSPEYVNGCSWALDPFWSQADIVCFVSDAASTLGQMTLWVLDPVDGFAYEAAYDGNDQGPVENVSVDAAATFCVYTVLSAGGAEGGTTYISMRDINNGTTYPIIEGDMGAYDAAISPTADWIVASLRDQAGTSDLWLFHRVDETLQRLTNGEQASSATWSPDGEWIAYLRRVNSGFELKAFRIDPQTGERRGDAKKLLDADILDATSGLSWAEL